MIKGGHAGMTGGGGDRPPVAPADPSARPPPPAGPAARLRRAPLDALAAVAVAIVLLVGFGAGDLNYDTFYDLVWGDDLVEGRRPQYDVPYASTPHPLATAAGALASPLGDAAEGVLLALGALAIGWLAVGIFRLGEALFGWPVGALAAVIVATRVPVLDFGLRGYIDLPTLALIVWASVLEARSPRRGAPVLALLSLAGLLRPETWLLAAAYWLWVAPVLDGRSRARLALLAASAPAAWVLIDLLISGKPLWSLTGTAQVGSLLGFPTGLGSLPEVVPRRLGEILRLPELVAAVLGFAAGTALLPRRAALPAALGLLNGLAFVAFAGVGIALLGRYLLLAATMLALFAALAATGWAALPASHAGRRPWLVAGTGVLLALAAAAPAQIGRLADARDVLAARARVRDDLRSVATLPVTGAALRRCGDLYAPSRLAVPALAYWTGLRPADIRTATTERPRRDDLVIAPAAPAVERLWTLTGEPRRFAARAPAGFVRVASNRSWALYAGCRAAGERLG